VEGGADADAQAAAGCWGLSARHGQRPSGVRKPNQESRTCW